MVTLVILMGLSQQAQDVILDQQKKKVLISLTFTGQYQDPETEATDWNSAQTHN